ncbi:uncharacterized protein LOC143458563 [Clavelina lepadiformis]|uniref:Uncharacterized protein n=1 Tax=Clavelina lepadiformis TaxID=159417 RepID=A0ABP0G342_CLALP
MRDQRNTSSEMKSLHSSYISLGPLIMIGVAAGAVVFCCVCMNVFNRAFDRRRPSLHPARPHPTTIFSSTCRNLGGWGRRQRSIDSGSNLTSADDEGRHLLDVPVKKYYCKFPPDGSRNKVSPRESTNAEFPDQYEEHVLFEVSEQPQ